MEKTAIVSLVNGNNLHLIEIYFMWKKFRIYCICTFYSFCAYSYMRVIKLVLIKVLEIFSYSSLMNVTVYVKNISIFFCVFCFWLVEMTRSNVFHSWYRIQNSLFIIFYLTSQCYFYHWKFPGLWEAYMTSLVQYNQTTCHSLSYQDT